ncbi:C2 domain containing [Olea europaea subsp. europaea]|uniref:C2 domain containing n=1 Tax=Olea europaea subsp. europaea TaxID=158383 RepID=A0A8S0V0M9_OLEEU|nr:C2 domain containing [Olea europaea subsp. europaea]
MSEPNLLPRKPLSARLREIEVLINSAQDLKNVKRITKMKTYAEVYVERDVHVARTHIDEHGETNPTWNEVVKVKFHEGLPQNDVMAALNVDIYAHSHVKWEKPVGSARILLCDVLKGGDEAEPLDNPIQCLTVQGWRDSGRPQGWLNLWVPPTGRFLIRRESLSFSLKEKGEEVAEVEGKKRGEEEVEVEVEEEGGGPGCGDK